MKLERERVRAVAHPEGLPVGHAEARGGHHLEGRPAARWCRSARRQGDVGSEVVDVDREGLAAADRQLEGTGLDLPMGRADWGSWGPAPRACRARPWVSLRCPQSPTLLTISPRSAKPTVMSSTYQPSKGPIRGVGVGGRGGANGSPAWRGPATQGAAEPVARQVLGGVAAEIHRAGRAEREHQLQVLVAGVVGQVDPRLLPVRQETVGDVAGHAVEQRLHPLQRVRVPVWALMLW